jgi:undecaprenyl-diphosphatase
MRKRIDNFNNLIDRIFKFKAHVLLIETLAGMLLSVGSFLLFIKLRGETFEKELAYFDNSVWYFFYFIRNPALTKIMITFSFIGGEITVGIVIILTILFFIKNHKREAFLLSFLFSVSIVSDTILKTIIQRPRPNIAPLITENNYSFPSGHAMDSFVFYISIAYFFYQIYRKKKLTILILILTSILVFIIGASRVYLGVHYATDILAGYIAGFCWLITVIVLEKTLIFFRLFKQRKK